MRASLFKDQIKEGMVHFYKYDFNIEKVYFISRQLKKSCRRLGYPNRRADFETFKIYNSCNTYIRDPLLKICLILALFCHVKNSPHSVQQNSNEKMKLDVKVSFILTFPGNIYVVILNQLLNNCYLWL